MNETLQKVGLNLLKLGVAVALSQIVNQTVRDLGNDTIGEVTKGIRSVRNNYQMRKQAA